MCKKILVVCSLGMSTSLLIKEMDKFNKNNYQIKCSDVTNAYYLISQFDLVLLAPHIQFLEKQFYKRCRSLNKPYFIIDENDYRHFNGEHILSLINQTFLDYEQSHHFKVILLHYQGMLSDLIYTDMLKICHKLSLDWEIESLNILDFNIQIENADIILLEPQIKYEVKKIINGLPQGSRTLVRSPSRKIYASFDGNIMIRYIQDEISKEGEKRK